MQTVSLQNIRSAAADWPSSWRTWVIATQDGGFVSHWNGQRYPRMTDN